MVIARSHERNRSWEVIKNGKHDWRNRARVFPIFRVLKIHFWFRLFLVFQGFLIFQSFRVFGIFIRFVSPLTLGVSREISFHPTHGSSKHSEYSNYSRRFTLTRGIAKLTRTAWRCALTKYSVDSPIFRVFQILTELSLTMNSYAHQWDSPRPYSADSPLTNHSRTLRWLRSFMEYSQFS